MDSTVTKNIKTFQPHLSIRQLDVDDLFILQILGSGSRLVDASIKLGLSQPAITQRIHKIEGALNCPILDRSRRGTFLTLKGKDVCDAAKTVLLSLEFLCKSSSENRTSTEVA
jgi:hypothetical protein